MMSYSLTGGSDILEEYQHFRGTCCLPPQCRRVLF